MTEIHMPSLPESSSSSSTSGKSIIRRNMFLISIAVASMAVVAFLSTDPFHNHSNVVDTEASSSSSSLLSPASFPSAHFRGANPHPTPEGQGVRNLGFWSNFWNAAIKPKQEETTTTSTSTTTTSTTTTSSSGSEAARDETMLVMSDPFPPSPQDDSNGDDSDVHLVSPADESTADDPPLCDTATHEGCPPGQLCWTPPSLYCPPSGCRPMCTCNPSSSIGAADSSAGILNGCDDGLFCRNPCAMADAGPECFQDEMTRDCAEWGANFMCDFDNGGGCAEKTEEVQDDGTTACPQDVFQCPDGSYVARDPKYDCQFSACDGDNGGMVQNGGTLIPMVNAVVPDRDDGTVTDGGECVSGKFHPPLVPTEYTCTNDLEVDPTWPEEGVFFETAEECCAVFGEEGTGYCQVIDVCAEADGGSEGDVPCEEKKFHPNHETGVGCTNSQQVDGATWKDMADFYFDTPEECCSLFANDDGSCTIVDVCADGDGVQPDDTGDGGNNDVVVGEGVCEDLKFHPNHQTGIGCSNSQNVAGAPWENNSVFYYDTVEECCAQFSNEDGTCDVYDICTMPPTTTTSTTTTSTTTTSTTTTTTTTTATTATTSTTTTEEPTTTTVPPTTTTEAATTTTTTDEPTTPKPTTTMGATTTAAAATTTAAAATTVPATATNPTCSQLPFHPPVPVVAFTCTNAIYSGDFLQPKHFFDSAEACCAAVANLQTGYCNVIDVCVEGEGEVEMKCEERKFHPNHVTGIGCTNSYEVEGATWKDIGDFYKETGEECCAFFGGGMECPIVDVCETDTASTAVTATTTTTSTAAATSVEPTTVPPTTTEATTTTESATTATTIPADCDQRPFHPHKDIIHTCTNSGDVEPYWSSALLFDSSEACCSMFKNSNDGSCDVIDVCKPTTTAVATTAPGDLACQDYKFHPGKEEGSGCTNSLDISDEMESVPHFFFDTAEECCDVFANPDTGACPIVDVCSEPPTTETPNGDTEMWYPDILNQAYTVGVCINILPVPESLDAFVYDSNLECCEEFYTDQSSGACLAAIASEKTTTTSTTTSTTIEEKTSTTTAVNVVQSDPPQCPGDQCLSPEGVCEDTYFCAINPCDLEPCRPDQECSSNFCGGCHHVCTDKTGVVSDAGTSTSTTTSATVVTTNTQERTDPTTARTSTTTSAATSTASKTTTPDPVTITTPTATTTVPGIKPGNCTTNRWHMSTLVGATYTCTNDDVYPEAWLAMEWRHFYDTATDCCQAFYGELPCTVDDICTRDKCAEKWHVSLTPGEEYTCTNSHDFLEQWDASYFYDSADECCLGYFDSPCNQVDTCSSAEPEATSCVDYWHPKPQSNACTNSGDHPEYWPDTMRYANAEDCCQGYFQSTCEQIDECISSDISSTSSTVPVKTTVPPTTLAASTTSSSAATTTSTTTTTTTSTTTEILTSSPTRNPTQSPSSSPTSTPTTTPTKFPTNAPTEVPTKTPTNAPTNTPTNAPTNTPTNAPTNTPTNAPTNTPTSEPTHNPTPIPTKNPTPLPTRNPTPVPTNKPTPVPQPFSSLSNGIDDFEDYYSTNGTPVDIPWNYGNPKQWVLDSSKKYSGSKSLVSIKPEGLGETSMLSLRITTTKWSILQCKIWVDTAMPWELFYVEVNGEQRNTYYQPSGEWISLVTGFDAGNNDIKFMVKNNDFYIGAPRNGPEDGSGRVWLDDCEIIPTGR